MEVAAADIGGGGASAVATWSALASGELALCGETYRLNVVVGPRQRLTLTSADPSRPAVVDGEDGVAVLATAAAGITLSDLELRGDLPLYLQCGGDGDPCGGAEVDVSRLTVTGGALSSVDPGAVLNVTESVLQPRAGYNSVAVSGSWWELALNGVTVRDHAAGGMSVTLLGPAAAITGSAFSGLGNAGGGALDVDWTRNFDDQNLDLTGTSFTDNVAGGTLATVYVRPGGPLTVTGGSFSNNEASAALDLGWAPSVVSGVSIAGQYAGAGVRGVATEWSDITCDEVWDSCLTLRESLGSGGQPDATLSGGSMTRGTNYAVQITWVDGRADILGIDFGRGATAGEYGDVAYGGNFYDYDGETSVTCTSGTCAR